jgi:predicted GIY-YIG superfamily endonuclease
MTEDDLFEDGFESATHLLGSVLYVLCLNETVVYIGRSENIIARLIKHRAQGRIAFNRAYTKTVPRDLAASEEATLIRHFKPEHNIASTPKVTRSTKAQIAAQARALLIVSGLKMDRRRF